MPQRRTCHVASRGTAPTKCGQFKSPVPKPAAGDDFSFATFYQEKRFASDSYQVGSSVATASYESCRGMLEGKGYVVTRTVTRPGKLCHLVASLIVKNDSNRSNCGEESHLTLSLDLQGHGCSFCPQLVPAAFTSPHDFQIHRGCSRGSALAAIP